MGRKPKPQKWKTDGKPMFWKFWRFWFLLFWSLLDVDIFRICALWRTLLCTDKASLTPSTFHSPKTYATMSTSPLEILVQYCGGWGYKRFFVSLKEALEKEFPGKVAITATQDTSSTGNFEVTLVKTGQLVHSKRNGGGKCDAGSEERAALFSLIRSMVA